MHDISGSWSWKVSICFAVLNFWMLCSIFMVWMYMQMLCSNSCWNLGDFWRQKFLQIKLYSRTLQLTCPRAYQLFISSGWIFQWILLFPCTDIPQAYFIVEAYLTEQVSPHNNQCSKSVSLNNTLQFQIPFW